MKILFLTLFLFSLASAQTTPADRKDGDLKFEPFTIPFEGQNVAAELGRLVVRENRSNPKTNLIELAFVRLKSTAEKPGFPVVYLDGGPGSSAINIARAPEYMRAFMKLREVGDVILLDQRGVGRSKPNLSRLSSEALPLDVFADNDVALRAFRERTVAAVNYFRSLGVDIQAYNTIESANDVDDVRKALGVEKLNLVGFSYGTHLGLACIRYHGPNLNRVVLIGTEGPDHTNKLPSTSDTSLKRLAKLAAAAPELEGKVPDLVGMLREVLTRLEKGPVRVQVTDQRTKKPVDLKIGKSGLQFLIMRDLGDSNDLPIFPAWFYTMHQGDYSILSRFAEKRYNQFGAGISLMTVVMDASSGTTKARMAKIEEEAKTAMLGHMVNFPFPGIDEAVGSPDLGDKFRSPIHTSVPTLFFSGTLDNNTPPFQADEVRKTFRNSTHLIVENAGHESMLVDTRVQQAIVEYLRGGDVSNTKIALPPLKFNELPKPKN
ncbi:MAG TPA: alpha/beta fold hydrolase [Pyrinomonadaceae bacterium]|nr:alpha/beta fold hydrolase [Pyrinomonadaceae bacterium]